MRLGIGSAICLSIPPPFDTKNVQALGIWVLWAHRWFIGPVKEIAAEQAGIDIDEPGAFARAEAEGNNDLHNSSIQNSSS
jgi:hypothetical protein